MSMMPLRFFFSSRRRHTRFDCDWSSDVCSSDLHWTGSLGFAADRSVEGDLALEVRNPTTRPLELTGSGESEDARWAFLPEQIGRASCRGRSVDLGGRRIIKKKKKGTKMYDGEAR